MGLSLNTISLLGILIGIGMIADNTIIVLEELSATAGRTPEGQGRYWHGSLRQLYHHR